MSQAATDDALGYCARIRDLILHHGGGWADGDALRKFRLLSYAASRAADDPESSALLRSVDQYASDLFSDTDHQKWTRGKTSGADILRLLILAKLREFRDGLLHRLRLAQKPDAPDADGWFYPNDE
jgi:hypothetical protein